MAKAEIGTPIRAGQREALWRSAVARRLTSASTRAWPLSPVRRFQLASLLVLLVGMLGSGWWLNTQIEQRVLEQTVNLNAAFIESFVAPLLQHSTSLGHSDGTDVLTPLEVASLDSIFHSPLLDSRILGVCLWAKDGRVLYSSRPAQIGQTLAPGPELAAAFDGRASWEMDDQQEQDAADRALLYSQASQPPRAQLGVYTPVRQSSAGPIITVAEFFLAADPLQRTIATAQQQTWMIVGGVAFVTYLLLAGFIRRTSDTVVRQQAELASRVAGLRDLLAQNDELRARMRQASRRAVTLQEQVLRSLSADLHDGPAQYLGLAFLHLDRIAARDDDHPERPMDGHLERPVDGHLEAVQSALGQVMKEIRAIAAGLGMPQLDTMTLDEVVAQVVRAHERSYSTRVSVETHALPEHADLSSKTTLYRVIQEGLANAYHHGRGIDERVAVWADADALHAEITDGGPGFDVGLTADASEHMGLSGMRARVESLGGTFSVQSSVGMGTQVRIQLPLSDSTDSR